MIVDSSALVAIALREAGSERVARSLASAVHPSMSAATWLESGIVLDSRTMDSGRELDLLLAEFAITVVPVTFALAQTARAAHRRYGRGSGSRARLNLGDCFSYALAVTTGDPLLFVGEDFTHTDVRSAL